MSSEDSFAETLSRLQAQSNLRPPPELQAAIRAECTKNLRAQRGLSRRARLVLSGLLGTSAVLLLWMVGERGPDTSSAVLLGAAAWGGTLGMVLLLGLGRTATCHSTCPSRWMLLILLPALFYGGLHLLGSRVLSVSEFFGSADQVWRILPCGSLALGTGGLVSGGIMLLWRRTDPFSPGLSGALVGLLGGMAGAVGVGFACPSAEVWHMYMGHGFTIAALVTLGWLVGRRLLPP